jgi:sodium-dependent dicarboxylate transporter 2/3/5
VVLAALGRLRTDDLGRISWSTLLTFGGGLTLGLALTTSGVADAVAVALSGLQSVPSEVSVAMVALVALVMTTVASNTATAATLIPLSIPLAILLGVDPVRLVVTVALASSVDFALVIGTPPTMLAYSTGLFRVREIFRIGVVFDLIGILLVVVALPWIWDLLGVL